MDLFTCSACGGKLRRDKKLGMCSCQDCGKVNRYAFISYSTKNQEIADSVLHIFSEQGIPVWMAPNDIPVGEVYASVISRALNNCSCLVLLLSKDAQESMWVTKEVEMVLSANKPILPMQIEDLVLNETFCFLIHANQIKALPKLDVYDPEFQKLLEIVQKYVDMDVAPPPPLNFWEKIKRYLKALCQKWKYIAAACVAVIRMVFAAAALTSGGQEAEPAIPEVTEAAEPAMPEVTEAAEPQEAAASSDEWKANVLAANVCNWGYTEYPVYDLGIYRHQVVSVTFLDTTETAPSDAQDVSAAKNGRVLAWASPSDEGPEQYNLFFAADGGINAVKATPEMFMCYWNLRKIDFGNGFHTDMVQDMHNMFYGCNALEELDLSGFNTENVTDMALMFAHCFALSTLDLSELNTSNVENMGWMFLECSNLVEVNLSGWDTSSVLDMCSMFGSCGQLLQLDLSGWDTSAVMDMSDMFSGCGSLFRLDLSDLDTSHATNMSGMFRGCYSLAELDLSNFDTASVTDMSDMFSGCGRQGTTADNPFFNGSGLTKLDLSHFDTSQVTDMSGMFYNCYNLTQLELGDWDTSNVTSYSGFMDSEKTYKGRPWGTLFGA